MFAKKIWDPVKQKYVPTDSQEGKKLLSKFIKNIKIMGGADKERPTTISPVTANSDADSDEDKEPVDEKEILIDFESLEPQSNPEGKKKVIICFDLNKTLIFTDAASNQPFNVALSGFIAEAFYGKMSEKKGFELLEEKNLVKSLVQANNPQGREEREERGEGEERETIISFNQYLNMLETLFKDSQKEIGKLLKKIDPEKEKEVDVVKQILSSLDKIIHNKSLLRVLNETNDKLLSPSLEQNEIKKLKNKMKCKLKDDPDFHEPENDHYLDLILNPRKIAKGMFINKDPNSGDLNMDGIIKYLARANKQDETAIGNFKAKIQQILNAIEKKHTLTEEEEKKWMKWSEWIEGACENKNEYPKDGRLHYDGKSAEDTSLRLDPKKRYIAPSFFHTLNQLNKHGIDYTIVFRTFGHDAHIIASEFDAFQHGKHPFESKTINSHKKAISTNKMASGNGEFYHIVRSEKEGEGEEDIFFLVKGQGPAEIGLNYMQAVIKMKSNDGDFKTDYPVDQTRSGKDTPRATNAVIATLADGTEVNGRKLFYDFLMEKAETNTHIAIRDNFKAWTEDKTNSRNSVRGKIVVYKEDDHIIFFDDNVDEYPNIVDPVLMTEEGEILQLESQVKTRTEENDHVVRANPIDTILNKNCFLGPIGKLIGKQLTN